MVAIPFLLVLTLASSAMVVNSMESDVKVDSIPSLHRGNPKPPKVPTESVYEWIPSNRPTRKKTSNWHSVRIGLKYLLQKLNLKLNEFQVMTKFTDKSKTTHVYGVSLYQGLPIGNLHAGVHIKNGHVFFYSITVNSDQRLTKRSLPISESNSEIPAEEAVKRAEAHFDTPFYPDISPAKEYYMLGNRDMMPVWKFQLKDYLTNKWLEVKVDATNGKYYNRSNIISSTDFQQNFAYTAIKLPNKSPEDGFSTIVDPENIQSSPNGWTHGYETYGNNAISHYMGDTRSWATNSRVFGTQFDPTLPPQTPANIGAGVVNAFYGKYKSTICVSILTPGISSIVTLTRGGEERDPIIISIQPSHTANNAGFQTFPDGQPGLLFLGTHTLTNPARDSALDNDVLIHELGHGLSQRLVGGAWTVQCLSTTESLGMGEGYSDILVVIFTATSTDTRWTKKSQGAYTMGDPKGVRRVLYTTDMEENHLTYKDGLGEQDVYCLGEIWASLLLEVYWNFVDKYGFSADLHDATQRKGNIMFLQIFVGALMIQPCRPTFISARDSMLAADDAYYGGANKCLIFRGFAKRGLGIGADSSFTNSNSIPPECKDHQDL
ncbi:hypothetical protein BASA61_002407 [Batrachochytrium salamandrivorans]|nr:hypothetical protein BASA61_002407 [Batrachochytrium salamandrivorans]